MLAGNLTLLGISNAAISVSTNSKIRESILKRVIDAKLLGSIGRAERDTALKKAVDRIIQDKETYKVEKKIDIDLDEKELKKYIDFIIHEVKENNRKGDTIKKNNGDFCPVNLTKIYSLKMFYFLMRIKRNRTPS